MRQELVELVKTFEGCRLKAYLDVGGIWTIGWGYTSNSVGPNTVWTQGQADEMLKVKLYEFYVGVKEMVGIPVKIEQLEALTSLAYNIGLGALRKSTLLKKLNKCDIEGAADEFLRWNKVNGKVVDGLTRRRQKERELFLS